jgi:hypothetical protein
MKKLIPILLASIMAFQAIVPAMEISELNKIPELISHYKHHRKADQSLSLLAFIKLHYDDETHHQKDHQTHDQLPFTSHHHHNCQLFQLVYTLPDLIATSHSSFIPVERNFEYKPFEIITVITSIWQPPRLS